MCAKALLCIILALYVGTLEAFQHSPPTPNAQEIIDYYVKGEGAGRYSSDVMEDALLDLEGLIRKYRYPYEEHNVITEDGYILKMQRIPYGRDRNNFPDPAKPVVFVMHGILSSAADFVVMGPGTALAYYLAEEGYDVWLGNARGTFFSRNHVSLDPDVDKEDFWTFSWDEIGSKDLPAMIDYALRVTGKSRLHYIGHSQGTTVFWVMGSIRPEYNSKIISMQAFGPVAYMDYNDNVAMNLLAPVAGSIESFASLIGKYELLANNPLFARLGATFCKDGALTQPICTNMLVLLAGPGKDFHNSTMLPAKLSHAPGGCSVRQLVHYGQHISKNYFRRYDYGARENRRRYGNSTPPLYDLSKITTPVFLHYAETDNFAALRDVDRLFEELGRPIAKVRVSHPNFSHVDFMWGTQAKSLVYERAVNYMKALGNN